MTDTGYWLITVQQKYCSGYSTRPIDRHPADYMAENLREEGLVFAMPISEEQYKAMMEAWGY